MRATMGLLLVLSTACGGADGGGDEQAPADPVVQGGAAGAGGAKSTGGSTAAGGTTASGGTKATGG
jgi:hypothetical protein